MTKFTLNIQIDKQGITNLQSAQMSVAMMQAVPDSQYLVVAVLTNPLENIIISWDNSVDVYTSGFPLKSYTTLKINSHLSALPDNLYSFNGYQITCLGSGYQGSIQLENQSKNTITAGLANSFTVNGEVGQLAIMTALSLLYNGLGTFQISNNFWLTVLANANVGTVIPSQAIPNTLGLEALFLIAAQPALLLQFSDANASYSVKYDDKNNEFILQY